MMIGYWRPSEDIALHRSSVAVNEETMIVFGWGQYFSALTLGWARKKS